MTKKSLQCACEAPSGKSSRSKSRSGYIPSDGEYGKPSSGYVNERLSGFERRPRDPNESPC